MSCAFHEVTHHPAVTAISVSDLASNITQPHHCTLIVFRRAALTFKAYRMGEDVGSVSRCRQQGPEYATGGNASLAQQEDALIGVLLIERHGFHVALDLSDRGVHLHRNRFLTRDARLCMLETTQ